MEENLLIGRLLRLIVAICCTAMSYMGIEASWPLYKMPIWGSAWVAYFLILFFWIKNNRAPRILMIVGTLFGTISLFSTFLLGPMGLFLGLICTLPAIALMTYVHILSFKEPESVPQ